jgi:hypothetical protein
VVAVASVAVMLWFANCALAGSAPRGFRPQAFSAVNRNTWWVLGSRPCGPSKGPCSSLILTTDNGRTFSGVHVPASTFSGVAFANLDDGYLIDQAGGVWITRDGGLRWKYTTPGGTAEKVVTGRHYVYATVVTHDSRLLLTRSTVGSSRWETLTAAGEGVYGVSLRGNQLLVSTEAPVSTVSTTQTTAGPSSGGQLLSSTDGGSTFSSLPEPTGVTGACLPEQPTKLTIWLLCGGAQRDWNSTDAGASYTPMKLPSGIGWFNAVDFFDRDRDHALALGGPSDYSPQVNLYRTSDGGATYGVVKFR